MRKSKFELITIFVFLMAITTITSSQAHASKIFIEILPVIKGMTYFVNYSELVNQTPQKIWTYWEDKGSVGCINRMRIDIYNESMDRLNKKPSGFVEPLNVTNQNKLLYTAWSKAANFYPGANDDLITYWYPFNISGNFTAQFRLYSCNEVYEREPFSFEVMDWQKLPDSNESRKIFSKVEIENKEDNSIQITLKSNKDLNSTLVLPEKYPRGWIFESAQIDELKNGIEERVNLKYIPGIWHPANITLAFVTEDGRYYFNEVFEIKKEKPKDWGLIISIIACIMFLAALYSMKAYKAKNRPKGMNRDMNQENEEKIAKKKKTVIRENSQNSII